MGSSAMSGLREWPLGWLVLPAIALTPVTCNALWSVDELSYEQPPGGGSTAAGGGGNGGATTASGGAGGSGGDLPDASSDVTSEAIWVEQTLVFGERTGADVTGVTEDTHITSEQNLSALNYGEAIHFGPDADPHRVGLLRFDLTALPAAALVQQAELELYVAVCTHCHAEASTVQVYQLLEDWKEGTQNGQAGSANWWQRLAGTAWSTVGAGPGSRDTAVLVDFDPNAQGQAFVAALPSTLVQQWVDDPASNVGLCLEATPGTVDGTVFVSSENDLADQRPVLRVVALIPQ